MKKKELLFNVTCVESSTFDYFGYHGHFWKDLHDNWRPQSCIPERVYGALMDLLKIEDLYG